MTTINLDDIITYKPPIAERADEPKPPRAPSLAPSFTPGLDLAYSFPPLPSWGSRVVQAQSPHAQNLHNSVTEAPSINSWSGDCGLGVSCEHLEVRGQRHCIIPTMRTACGNVSASQLTKDNEMVEDPDAECQKEMDNRDIHSEPFHKNTQGAASRGPNALRLLEPSPHPFNLGQTSVCNIPSLPDPLASTTKRMIGFPSTDQANSPDDLAQPTGRNFDIIGDSMTTGDNRVAVGAQEPRTYAGVTAFCDIQPTNNAQNIQTGVSKDIVEVENRDIATIKRNKHGNTDPSIEERAPGDDESRRQSVDESCVALPNSTSLAHPFSPPPKSREGSREFSSQPKLTVTTSNRGSRSQSHQRSPLRPQISHVGKRKFPANTTSNESSDDSDDSDDRDYMESHTKSQGRKPFSRSTKQARRSSTCVAPARTAYSEPLPLSTADASGFEMPEKQAFPTSLQDTETIAVRGFLTRQIFLSRVVYSFTFEEQREQSDSKDRAKVPTDSDKGTRKEPSKKSKTQKPKAYDATTGTRLLREDDRLLIELKEKGDLSWNQIAEHFPGRSKGALQVRYCTRLKNRTARGSEQTTRTQKLSVARRNPSRVPVADDYRRQDSTYPIPQLRSMTVESPDPNNLPRKRYGPPRARRAVDRYFPI